MKSDQVLLLDQFLPFRLNNLSEIVSQKFAERYRALYSMSRPEWRTLAVLGEKDQLTATTIGRITHLHKTKVSRAVASLQKRGWLTRKTDLHDRRVEHLMLTAQGRRHYAKLIAEARQFEAQILQQVGQDAIESLWKAIEDWEHVGVSSKSIA